MDMLILSDGNDDQMGGIGEVYSPPRVVPIARAMGLAGGWSLDLTSKNSEGQAGDFDLIESRRRCEQLVDKSQPTLIIGSVMCTMFSIMTNIFRPQQGEKVPESVSESAQPSRLPHLPLPEADRWRKVLLA